MKSYFILTPIAIDLGVAGSKHGRAIVNAKFCRRIVLSKDAPVIITLYHCSKVILVFGTHGYKDEAREP